jgi:hypothetical protein
MVPSFKKGHFLAKKGHRRYFRDTSNDQGDTLGILLDKTGFWTLIEGEKG